jgi:four helix bundle protein
MADFKKLAIWQRAHALAIDTHRAAGRIRGTTHVSLRNQLVRAAMSVPTNIVEGRAQKSEADFCRFLGYAVASLDEVEYHLIVAHDLEAMSDGDFRSLTEQLKVVRKQIHALMKRLKQSATSQKSRRPNAEAVLG